MAQPLQGQFPQSSRIFLFQRELLISAEMQTVPAALPETIGDPKGAIPTTLKDTKATIEHVENIALRGPQERRDEAHDIETVALFVKEPKADFELQTIVLDEIRENEVLVEMKYSGICVYRLPSSINMR